MSANKELGEIDFNTEAQRLVQELQAYDGKKALILVVDDTAAQREFARAMFERGTKTRNIGYIVETAENGEDAIALYQAFKQADSQENPHKVVIVLDGNLTNTRKPTGYRLGAEVAAEIAEVSKNNGWDMPYLVGYSSEEAKNQALGRMYPDVYITSYQFKINPLFDAVEERL